MTFAESLDVDRDEKTERQICRICQFPWQSSWRALCHGFNRFP
jgi:hypothetical protein